MDAETHAVVVAAFNIREGAKDLTRLYNRLSASGLSPRSATVDGNPQQLRYIPQTWPQIKLQRCLIHVHRQGLSWCRRHPSRTDAKHLRRLFLLLPSINTPEERDQFIRLTQQWEQRFGHRFHQSREHGWVFNDLRLARGMLLHALPHLFHYLDDERIPRSTNALEGYFSRMKEKYRRHRGLSIQKRDAYFQWYFYLKPK
jgi:transposase-like protein